MPASPPIPPPAVEPWIARAIGRRCRQHAQNLFIASFFLPPRKRLAVQAVGAFVAMLEEVFDVDLQPQAASAGACASGSDLDHRLQLVRERLDGIYAGQTCPPLEGGESDHAVIHVLASAIERYQIPKEWFIDLVEAMKSAAMTMRWATWSSLQRLLRRRGGSVGLILSAVLGLTNSSGQEQAIEMGIALELTRILRDLKKHAQGNRVLLPLEDLARFRYSERDLAAGVVNDSFRSLIRFQIDRAREYYRTAATGICWLGGDGSRLAAATIAVLHSGILRRIEQNDYDVFTRPPKIGAAYRLRKMADAWRLARRRPGERQLAGWERL